MDGPSRSGGLRQSRRSRSQRDRERRRRRADLGASSPSSASDQELCRGDSLLGAGGGECRPLFPGARHRPPRRRKRESVSCEEDIIDGFAIASFISLEALEVCVLFPSKCSRSYKCCISFMMLKLYWFSLHNLFFRDCWGN